METTGVCAISLLCLVALSILKQYKPEWTPLLRMVSTLLFLGLLLTVAAGVLTSIREICGGALPEETWGLLCKALGLAFLTELTSGICRDSGETSLATWVEATGRIEILLLALPLLNSVAALISGWVAS